MVENQNRWDSSIESWFICEPNICMTSALIINFVKLVLGIELARISDSLSNDDYSGMKMAS